VVSPRSAGVLRAGAVLALLLGASACETRFEVLSSDGGFSPDAGDGGAADAGPNVPTGNWVVAAGQEHTCFLSGGALSCFGTAKEGRLGDGRTTGNQLRPLRVGAASDWQVVAVGEAHTCALKADGSVWCWGANGAGQLGQGDTTARSTPQQVPLPARARDVQARFAHTCAVLETGAVECWGANFEGQLGLGDNPNGPDVLAPIVLPKAGPWRSVAPGQGHTCAIAVDGGLWCWGRNTENELGLGPGAGPQLRTPQRVGAALDWVEVVAGQSGTCGLRADRSLWCWGVWVNGVTQQSAPTQLGSATDWALARIDTFHLCALKLDGALWCLGRNIEGQLGLAAPSQIDVLTQIEPSARWSALSTGRFHTCARKAAGTVWCTGANANPPDGSDTAGWLGVGDFNRRSAFTEVLP
jgi:alpha-tubulin suppressor-like RCC1 family protein